MKRHQRERALPWNPLLFLAGVTTLTACGLFESEPPTWVEEGEEEFERGAAPVITEVKIPVFPPLGEHDSIQVTATDDDQLESISARFLDVVREDFRDATGTLYASGRELGEGLGTLTLVATDWEGGRATQLVESVLVDLSPPILEVSSTLVRRKAGETFRVWVADAWVLGSVEVWFQGSKLFYHFPDAYPSTLGETWDQSLVTFDADQFPEGTVWATIVASDASGNQVSEVLELVVDGTPPVVELVEPLPGASVSGSFVVEAKAADENPGLVTIELRVAGAPVAVGTGPTARFHLNSAEFGKGETTLSVVAYDAAGNESEPVPVTVQFE